MATSGTSDFNLEFDDMIVEAYERCGIEVRDGYDMKTAMRSINLLFAEWANRGLNLWTIEQRQVTLVAGTYQYSLPLDTVDALSAVIRTNAGQSTQQDITVDRIGYAEYLHVPNKNTQSRPAQWFLQRTTTPQLFLYPAPDATQTYVFRYYAVRRIQDAGTFTNTADVVFRFLPCLVAGLAYYLSVKKAPDRVQLLKAMYDEEFTRAANEDRENSGYFAVPMYQSR
ncbi:MAG: hypothetical protein ACO260_05275 [Hylemonella sp.]